MSHHVPKGGIIRKVFAAVAVVVVSSSSRRSSRVPAIIGRVSESFNSFEL